MANYIVEVSIRKTVQFSVENVRTPEEAEAIVEGLIEDGEEGKVIEQECESFDVCEDGATSDEH